MRILAVDVGTGTQDILLFDTAAPVENSVKLVMPSRHHDRRRPHPPRHRRPAVPVVLAGVIQGGGPCHWALEDHLRAGLPAFATPEAAHHLRRRPRQRPVLWASPSSPRTKLATHRPATTSSCATSTSTPSAPPSRAFDVDAVFDAFAVGCLDHGASPPGYSDRLFRFDHLRRVVEADNDLRAFAYLPGELPDYLTRARALLRCRRSEAPTVFLDTGPAAALGALQDPTVAATRRAGSCSTSATCTPSPSTSSGTRIVSLYEHHTGEMTGPMIEDFTTRLVAGALQQAKSSTPKATASSTLQTRSPLAPLGRAIHAPCNPIRPPKVPSPL